MADLKHVGRFKSNNRKCIVAYRVVPKDPEYCLVIPTEALDAEQHDSLISLVESNAGQTAYELAEAMNRASLPDGRNMLQGMVRYGKLQKVKTSEIVMVPNSASSINLEELNSVIAQQKGVTVAELALGGEAVQQEPEVAPVDAANVYTNEANTNVAASTNDVLSDEDLAAQYRSQADSMFKEAKRLREQAEELAPTKKKTATKKTTSSAEA